MQLKPLVPQQSKKADANNSGWTISKLLIFWCNCSTAMEHDIPGLIQGSKSLQQVQLQLPHRRGKRRKHNPRSYWKWNLTAHFLKSHCQDVSHKLPLLDQGLDVSSRSGAVRKLALLGPLCSNSWQLSHCHPSQSSFWKFGTLDPFFPFAVHPARDWQAATGSRASHGICDENCGAPAGLQRNAHPAATWTP